jgi:hypothetical protein
MMKTFKSVLLFTMIITLCFFLKSCLKEPSIYSDFLIKVDSIHVRDTLASAVPFDIEFFGTIGYNGCNSFKTFDQTINDKDIKIGAWGTYENKSACPSVMVFLNGQKLNMTIPFAGIYNITISEPDNSYLVRKIVVN